MPEPERVGDQRAGKRKKVAGIDIGQNFPVIPIAFDTEAALLDGRKASSFSNVQTSDVKLPNTKNCRQVTVRLSAPRRRWVDGNTHHGILVSVEREVTGDEQNEWTQL